MFKMHMQARGSCSDTGAGRWGESCTDAGTGEEGLGVLQVQVQIRRVLL